MNFPKGIIFIISVLMTLKSFSQTLNETRDWLSKKLNYHYCFKRIFHGKEEEYSYDLKIGFNKKSNVMTIYEDNLLDCNYANNYKKEKTNLKIQIKMDDIDLNKFKYQTFECKEEDLSCSTSLALRMFIYTNHKSSVKWANSTKGTTENSDFVEFWFDIPRNIVSDNENLGERLQKALYHLALLSGSKKEVF